jgi:glycosyltransferase involved in cell wall biosynthesis
VGWIGSHSTAAYLKPLLPVFATINRSKLQARLVVVGADLGLEAEWLEQRAWSLASERDDLASFDIGIMPLPNTDWARGKCGYKLLQYFSAGIPVIASPVGVNVNMVGSERGLLANEAEAWRAALERLLADAEERRERGRLARTFMESSYSYKRWAPELAALLRTVQV